MESLFDMDQSDSKKYKVQTICNSTGYTSKLGDHLLNQYHLILWKNYVEEENI